ncbi:uncharacterized protein PHACADRAFT_256089 [Phanerochaete carnosa HHB-10118-sp]|uniref:FYVE-type domain-containing protein n=1 Tax=Phanerochaete carnosa (strain HHB-10118-sp) TaxID=650164 RepID=K5W8E9_PHACS|nr:uncharacterized protein PHACADRAFT_256089 [Phanerochaete carnosa HHB-10118-sp]EKM55455.1 hypothetical protein PHACADRAFT_256089 [Phanerochaete carnosa HHB-10118-sp]
MQAQPNVPYQAYKPRRHHRNVSAQNNDTKGTVHASRPQTTYSQINGNGMAHGHNLSEPIVPLQRDFLNHSEKEVNGKEMDGSMVAPDNLLMDQTRRTVSMSNAVPPFETSIDTPPTAGPELVHIPQVAPKLPSSPSSDDGGTSGSSSGSAQSTPLSTSPSTRPPSAVSPTVTSESQNAPGPTSTQPEESPVASASSLSSSTAPAQPEASANVSPRPALGSVSSSRKGSTFRRIPLRQASSKSAASSPLRPQSTHSHTPSNLSQSIRVLDPTPARPRETVNRVASPLVAPQPTTSERALPPLPNLELPGPSTFQTQQTYRPYTPAHAQRTASVSNPTTASPTAVSPPAHFSKTPILPTVSPSPPTSSVAPGSGRVTPGSRVRTPAPYRPGFQPKGVYRPRTDEFLEARKRNGDKDRVEQTRLERRLEKLINLHFPHPDLMDKHKGQANGRPQAVQNRRASSFFDIDITSLKGKSAGDLWKGVVQAQVGGKNDIRAAEQAITPWEDDASVSQCPLCQASFHPLTNRKHHCRLCGRIICSLPPRFPQRPQPCSLLFVADPTTGQIEEVGEGVHYGVRRRTTSTQSPKGKGRDDAPNVNDEDKFLRGVRICRDCKPVLLRQQYMNEAHTVPLFIRLYEAFISIEKEITEILPRFQELMLSLNNDERPSPEALAARKRLLETFAQYDAIAKRIRKIPCKGDPGSSQDRVQQAIVTRANLFLQKNMFPLQALPKPGSKVASPTPSPPAEPQESARIAVDPDSEVARILQPLLEQEALLESFVEEAKAQRKFEDTQTLKANLNEIRAEIDRVLARAEGGLSEGRPMSGNRTKT